METVILTLAIGFVLLELIEHVAFPIFWFIKERKRKSVCGIPGMLGEMGEIKQWRDNQGQVSCTENYGRYSVMYPIL